MNKNFFSIIAALTLVFFASCEKENNPDSNNVNIDNTTWTITSNPVTGSSYDMDVLFKDNDSIYINSFPIALGTWEITGDSVQFGIDTLGANINYKGGFPTDTTMQGRISYGVVPIETIQEYRNSF